MISLNRLFNFPVEICQHHLDLECLIGHFVDCCSSLPYAIILSTTLWVSVGVRIPFRDMLMIFLQLWHQLSLAAETLYDIQPSLTPAQMTSHPAQKEEHIIFS